MKKDENNETRKLFIRVATQLLYGVIQFQVVWLCCICNLTANFSFNNSKYICHLLAYFSKYSIFFSCSFFLSLLFLGGRNEYKGSTWIDILVFLQY